MGLKQHVNSDNARQEFRTATLHLPRLEMLGLGPLAEEDNIIPRAPLNLRPRLPQHIVLTEDGSVFDEGQVLETHFLSSYSIVVAGSGTIGDLVTVFAPDLASEAIN